MKRRCSQAEAESDTVRVSAILTIFALIGAIELCRDIAAGRSTMGLSR